jgi:hypothetical protein
MSAMQNLADADAAELTAAERAEILRMLEQLDAVETVARSRVLNVFDANDDFELDGHRSVSAWLVNETGITKAEAGGHREWAKTVAGFPVIAQAMVDRVLRKSPVRKVCSLLAKIPAEHRAGAEQIIVQAAGAGAVLRDLVYLAAEIAARIAPLPGDGDEAGRVKDGNLRLETTLDGAGVLRGELTPECVAAVQAVLGALSNRSGPEDHRSHGERLHDGLCDAMRRLLGSELVPEKQGHPVTALVHIGLADLIALDEGSVFLGAWATEYARQWAGHRAATSVQAG